MLAVESAVRFSDKTVEFPGELVAAKCKVRCVLRAFVRSPYQRCWLPMLAVEAAMAQLDSLPLTREVVQSDRRAPEYKPWL